MRLIARSMSGFELARYVNPWKFRRDQEEQRVTALRHRDGDRCKRCKRPIRFDLPAGHDMGVKIEPILPASAGGSQELDNLCLTHGRCNAKSGCDTAEVRERARVKNEAALFVKARKQRRRA
jgi:hypothetical protein